MSNFLDSILDLGSGLWKGFTGPGTGSAIARATALGYLLKQVQDSINKDSQRTETSNSNNPDYGTRLQINPSTETAIPLVYGEAFLGGAITDAALTNNNQTMWYCVTLCERTGTLLSTGQQSVITFENIYVNDNLVTFQTDGITVASLKDNDGNVNTDIAGLIKIYCFNNGSNNPVTPSGYSNASLQAAFTLFPNWTAFHTMNNLVFALVRIDYNKIKNVTGLGSINFKIRNTLTLPGDVLYDYMTNTRYGAGLPAAEIFDE